MALKKVVPKKPKLSCKCGAPATGYLNPAATKESKEATRRLHFDPKTLKGYYTCRHGNEFEYTEVKE